MGQYYTYNLLICKIVCYWIQTRTYSITKCECGFYNNNIANRIFWVVQLITCKFFKNFVCLLFTILDNSCRPNLLHSYVKCLSILTQQNVRRCIGQSTVMGIEQGDPFTWALHNIFEWLMSIYKGMSVSIWNSNVDFSVETFLFSSLSPI